MFDQRVVVRSWKARESEGRAGLAYLYPSFGVVAIVILFVGVTSFRIKGEAASSNLCGLMPVPIPPKGSYLLGVPMKDYGMPCERGSDCSSGLCGVSCSALNWAPDNATSCICPISSSSPNSTTTNAYEKRCCGCVTNSQDRIHTCPDYPGFVRVEGREEEEEGAGQFGQRPYDCGWWGNFEWSDDVFEEPDLPYVKTWHLSSNSSSSNNNNNIESSFGELQPDASSGIKRFGERCGEHSECQSGMCGFDCDCSSASSQGGGGEGEPCSCQCLSVWPVTTCCGCFIGNNSEAGSCPTISDNSSYVHASLVVTVSVGLNTSSLCKSESIILPPVPPWSSSSSLFNLPNSQAQSCAQKGNCTSADSFPYPPRPGYPRPKYAFEYADNVDSAEEYWRTRPITCADGVQSRCNVDLHCVT